MSRTTHRRRATTLGAAAILIALGAGPAWAGVWSREQVVDPVTGKQTLSATLQGVGGSLVISCHPNEPNHRVVTFRTPTPMGAGERWVSLRMDNESAGDWKIDYGDHEAVIASDEDADDLVDELQSGNRLVVRAQTAGRKRLEASFNLLGAVIPLSELDRACDGPNLPAKKPSLHPHTPPRSQY